MGEENNKLSLVDSLAVRYRPRQFSDIVGNTGNIKQIKGFLQKGQLPRTWLFSGNPGAGKCLTGNSLVQTPDGLLDIETVVGNDFLDFKEKEIQIINGDGEVETTSHVYRALAHVTIKITTLRGNTLTGTPEHPIVVLGEQGKVWKPLKELAVGDAPFVYTSVEHLCGFYDKISNIEVIKEPCFVYDLTLPETHSFIANGFINHNTTSARILAMTVNCENIAENIRKGNPEPCLKCRSCRLALEGKHPDVIEINCGSEDGGVQGMRDLVNSIKLAPRFNIKCFLLDECLPLDAAVVLSDGSTVALTEVLENQDTEYKVLSYDTENNVVEEDVIENTRLVGEKDMLEIELEDGSTQRCSTNHKWWSVTRKKYVRADELMEGEELLTLD